MHLSPGQNKLLLLPPHSLSANPFPAGSTPATPNQNQTMTTTNYHNEYATFTIGGSVTHVTDDGSMISATITGFSDELIELAFADGGQGSEHPSTCF